MLLPRVAARRSVTKWMCLNWAAVPRQAAGPRQAAAEQQASPPRPCTAMRLALLMCHGLFIL